MVMKLAVGPSSPSLGGSLAERLHVETVNVAYKEFPDGETYVRIEDASPSDSLVLVQSLAPPQAKNLVILLQMSWAAKRIGVRDITAVVPYLAYSRQDKVFLAGEVLSAELVPRTLETCSLRKVYIVEPHSEESLSFFNIPTVSVSPLEDVAQFLRKRDNYVIVAPDTKRTPDAKALASMLSTDFGWIEKERDRVTGKVMSKVGSVPKTKPAALLFDDMISSGSTIVEAAKLLRSLGFERLEAGCVHGLFVQGAEDRMTSAGVTFVFASDTIEGRLAKYSVVESIAKSVEKDIQ